MNANKVITKIRKNGPTRVVIETEEGCVSYAGTPAEAAKHGIFATGALIRNDGWSLGYTEETEKAAYDLWAGDWDYRVCLLTHTVETM